MMAALVARPSGDAKIVTFCRVKLQRRGSCNLRFEIYTFFTKRRRLRYGGLTAIGAS
jgi:hypothetical protein